MTIITSLYDTLNKKINIIYYLYNVNYYDIIYNLNLKNFIYESYIISIILCISSLYLSDGIYTHWKNIFNKNNNYNTKKYNNILLLFLYETLKYLTQIPNLITLFVGIIQVIYVTKFINIIVTILCWIFSISNELIKYYNSKKSDEIINSNCVLLDNNNNKIRSDNLKLNDNLILNYGDKTPAFIKITNIKYNGNKNIIKDELDDYDIGFYDDKESTGEDVSCSFMIGDVIPPYRIITRPNIIIYGKVVKYIEPISFIQFKHQITIPIFLNRIRFMIDLYAIILLFFISLFIIENAISNNNYNLKLILKHFFACIISGNILIPSMRMSLLYNIYNLLLSLSFITIKINSYDAFEKIDKIKSVIFDKTGTITEEYLNVHQHYIFNLNSIFKKLKFLEWENNEILFAITIANSESNIYENNGEAKFWGTSPEENKILEYWYNNKKVKLLFNPIKPFGQIIFKFPNLPERKIIIKNRHSYNFEIGKISMITFVNEKNGITKSFDLLIRQHGTSRFFDNKTNIQKSSNDLLQLSINENLNLSFDWACQITKNDKRRSMAIAIAIPNDLINNNLQIYDNNDIWEILSIYTFDNPLRTNVNNVVKFFRNKHIPCSILTGDGRETSEDIAKCIGFPENIYNIISEKNILDYIEIAKNHKITVSIDASILNNILYNTENLAEQFLNNPNIFKIIYKASKNIKEHVVVNTRKCLYVGDAKNDEFAIKKAYIGICFNHGAEMCKLYASICIKQPSDLIDLISENGYKDMLLVGGQKIFKDVCFISGLIYGCWIIGIHLNKFEFIDKTLLYKDIWDPIQMLVITSIQYTTSVIGYASSDCNFKNKNTFLKLGILSIINNICGILIGTLISYIIKNYFDLLHFNSLVLHLIIIIILLKHSFNNIQKRRLFGNQLLSNNNKIVGFIMNIFDSIPFRILLYFIFCYILN